MKMIRVLLTAALITLSSTIHAAQTASATLFCWSLRFQQGTDSFGDSTLDLTGTTGTANGELAPWYSVYTHRSGFVLDWMGFPINGTIYLDLPLTFDANDNGFDDSFEVSQAASGTSDGEYTTALGGGLVTATWSRGAGSKDGTCWLHLVDDTYGDLGTYRHTFEVLEYTGSLTYTPGTNAVSGSVNLTNAADQLQGAVRFVKSISNPSNQLTLDVGGWTNAAQQMPIYASRTFYRDPTWPTNYYGTISFDDGDLNTGVADYRQWELSIDDLNDSDHDGIPDFSDEPSAASPRRPVLTLTGTSTNLLLTISGDVGRLHHILEGTNLATGNWKTNLSLTLTNDPQTVSLPLPTTPVKFWRALVP
jgi:hypothetical protein